MVVKWTGEYELTLDVVLGQMLRRSREVSLLELLRVPCTGCNPRGLILARSQSLFNKLLAYHRIPVRDFLAFRGDAARAGRRSSSSR